MLILLIAMNTDVQAGEAIQTVRFAQLIVTNLDAQRDAVNKRKLK